MIRPLTASLFTRSANGLQAWPDDGTTIAIPAKCKVVVDQHKVTKDSAIQVMMESRTDDVALYIPRGGSVVIEVCE